VIDKLAKRSPGMTAVIIGLGVGIIVLLTGIGLAWVLDEIGVF